MSESERPLLLVVSVSHDCPLAHRSYEGELYSPNPESSFFFF